MAKPVVNLVVKYLADLIKEEAELLGGVRDEVAEFERSLRNIEAFLEDAESMEDSGQTLKEWVRQVRDVACDIENVVDEFLLRVGPKQLHRSGLAGYAYKFAHFSRQLRARHRIGSQIKTVKSRLHEIEVRKNMFASTSLVCGRVTAPPAQYDMRRLTEPQFVEDSSIVGIEKPKQDLIKLLLEEAPGLAVISVYGMGGLGKTTLVSKVYHDVAVQRRFDCFAWITVSQSFSPTVLLRKMFTRFMSLKKLNHTGSEEYHSLEGIECMDHAQLVDGLKAYMQQMRYLVVLDDVWTTNAWEDLRYVFPETGLKSRIMITTRRNDVASFCSGSRKENVYQMKPLPDKEAWTLFCKKAFGESCFLKLKNQSNDILKICKGLPLAIVTMSGLLLTKSSSPDEWNRVLQCLPVTLETSETTSFMNYVLWLGYNDLPHHLKYCLLYFGSYPEDYEVDGRVLMQQWISEGFVKAIDNKSLEDHANNYLHELVDRSLVEVEEYGYDGSILSCKVHDLMHQLILQKMREENFFTLSTDDIQPNEQMRRLSVTRGNEAPRGKNFSGLRTLYMDDAKEIPELSCFRMLRVLHLGGARIQEFPSAIVKLYHLTYLNLSSTQIHTIPKSIRNLRKLQTLDISFTNVRVLPADILHLHAIRHLYVYRMNTRVRMPTRLGQLKCLQELCSFDLDGDTEKARELGKLTQMRKLYIGAVQRQTWDAVCNSIMKMRHLKILTIKTDYEEEEAYDIEFVSTLSPSLMTIGFNGHLNMLPNLTGQFLSLVCLTLTSSRLSEDPLEAFQHLPALRTLAFCDTFNGETMSCGENSYLRLKRLIITAFERLRLVSIGNGAMPKLVLMEINNCCNLDGVPLGVENLKELTKLHFVNMPREFIQKLRENQDEIRPSLEHIPIVQHYIEDDDDTRREVEYLF